jgi:hypothetical protein
LSDRPDSFTSVFYVLGYTSVNVSHVTQIDIKD